MNHCFARRSKPKFRLIGIFWVRFQVAPLLEPLGGLADISLRTPLLVDEIQQLRRGPRVA